MRINPHTLLLLFLSSPAIHFNLNAMENPKQPGQIEFEEPDSPSAPNGKPKQARADAKKEQEEFVPAQPASSGAVAAAVVPVVKKVVKQNPAPLTQSRKVELDASSFSRKLGNWAYGTDEYLLDIVSRMADHQVILNDTNTQLVINSAVRNLIRHGDITKIETVVLYANTKRMGDPVIPLEPAAATELQDYLTKRRAQEFAAFHATCQQQMKPITTLGKLVDELNKVRGIKPEGDIDMSSLSHVNLQALHQMMIDMAANKDQKSKK